MAKNITYRTMKTSVIAEPLMAHQVRGIEITREFPRYGFFWEMGLGKTRLGLEIMRAKGGKGMVVCPLSIIQTAWLDDALRFAPDLTVKSLWAPTAKGRLKALREAHDADIMVINYDGFKIMAPELAKIGFSTLWIDESAALKGRTTKIAKYLTKFSRIVPNVYLASGCPCPNSELEWYAQMNVIASGLLGNSYWSFRGDFFEPKRYNPNNGIVFEWRVRKERSAELVSRIKTAAWFLKKQECLDLPDKTFMRRQVHLSPPEWAAYLKMRKDLLLQYPEGDVIASNVLVQIMKLRELTSGFAHVSNNGGAVEIGTSKLKALLELLSELGNERAVVWTHFHKEAEQIRAHLDIPIGMITGEVHPKVRDGYLAAWRDGELKYLICHPQAAGHGLTLTEASHAIYFSLSHSLELFLQSQDRIHRIGQDRPCTYHVLEAVGPSGEGTVDRAIWEALAAKDLTAARVLEGLRR